MTHTIVATTVDTTDTMTGMTHTTAATTVDTTDTTTMTEGDQHYLDTMIHMIEDMTRMIDIHLLLHLHHHLHQQQLQQQRLQHMQQLHKF